MLTGYESKRTKLGDPAYVEGLDEYQQSMLNEQTVSGIRRKISDFDTKNVSYYDPEGLESLETYVQRGARSIKD